MILGYATLALALVSGFQEPDPKTIVERLQEQFLKQKSFHLEYATEIKPSLATYAPRKVEVWGELPTNKIYVRGVEPAEGGRTSVHHVYFQGMVHRTWRDSQECGQCDYEVSFRPFLRYRQELLEVMGRLLPKAELALRLPVPVPTVELTSSPTAKSAEDYVVSAGAGMSASGYVASWMSDVRFADRVDAKKIGHLWEFTFPTKRIFTINEETGFLQQMEITCDDGSQMTLRLLRHQVGTAFPKVAIPEKSHPIPPQPETDEMVFHWHVAMLRTAITEMWAHHEEVEATALKREFAPVVSKWGAILVYECQRTLLRNLGKDQIEKLLAAGLTPGELRKDGPNLADGFVKEFEKNRTSFNPTAEEWKTFGGMIPEGAPGFVRKVTKTSGSTLEKIVVDSLEMGTVTPLCKRLDASAARDIYLSELEVLCGNRGP